jgi:hypothetical protein
MIDEAVDYWLEKNGGKYTVEELKEFIQIIGRQSAILGSGDDIKVDGIWGIKSRGAWEFLSERLREGLSD